MSTIANPVFVLSNGKTAAPLKPGQQNTFKAKAGERYRVTKAAGPGTELAPDVIVIKAGNDLTLKFSDGTQVTLENYYVECRKGGCDVSLPGPQGTEVKLSGEPADAASGTALGDGSTLVYAHGSQDVLMKMAQGSEPLQTAFAGAPGSEITYAAPAGGIPPLAGLAVLGAGIGGGGGGGGAAAGGAAVARGLAGVLADGYVKNALVFSDANGNKVWDHETFTDVNNNGYFDAGDTFVDGSNGFAKDGVFSSESFVITDAQGNFTGLGGTGKVVSAPLRNAAGTVLSIDISTGLPFTQILSAPEGSTVINPLTTLVAAKVSAGVSLADAQAQVAASLGLSLPNGATLTDYDPLAASNAGTAAGLAAQKAAVQVANLVQVLGAAIKGADATATDAGSSDLLFTALAAKLAAGSTVNLGDSTTIASVLTGASDGLAGGALAKLNANSSAISDALASVNQKIESITTIDGIGTTQKVAQSTLASNALSATSGVGTLDSSAYSGTNLDALVTLAADTVAPTLRTLDAVASSQPGHSLDVGDVVTVTLRLSETVKVAGTPQIALTIGTSNVQAAYASGSNSDTLVFTYTVKAGDNDADGISIAIDSFSLNGGSVIDSGGNPIVLPLNSGAVIDSGGNSLIPPHTVVVTPFVVDTEAPVLTITSDVAAVKAGETAHITFTFSEAPTGFVAGDIIAKGGTISGLAATSDAKIYTADFTPAANTTGNASITVAAGAYTDAAGNDGGAGTTPVITVDTARPTVVSIVMSDTLLGVGDASLVTFTFSEAISVFSPSGLNLANGVLTSPASSDGGVTWTATLRPNAVTDLTNVITYDASFITDRAGNKGTGTASSVNYIVDAKPYVDLSDIAGGTGGFVINGQCARDFSGEA